MLLLFIVRVYSELWRKMQGQELGGDMNFTGGVWVVDSSEEIRFEMYRIGSQFMKNFFNRWLRKIVSGSFSFR